MTGIARLGVAVLAGWFALGLPVQAQQATAAGEREIMLFAEIESLTLSGAHDQAEALLIETFLGQPDAPPETRIGWLAALAEVQIAAGKPGDAGDSHINRAQLMGRRDGIDSPTLAPVYRAAAESYEAAGNPAAAVKAYEAALALERNYLACDSAALTQLHAALARTQLAAGMAEAAAHSARLARDTKARCAASAQSRGLADLFSQSGDEGGFALVEIGYVTDRAATGAVQPEDFYGSDRADLSYGRALVSIPLSHKPGAIEASSLFRFEWNTNPARHVVLMEVEPVGKQGLFDLVAARPEGGDDGLFVFIHGYNSSFAKAAKRTAQMAYDMNFTGQPILYSWPSRGKAGAYVADTAAVEYSARHLLGFLRDLVAGANGRPIHIVAHSMGNRALMDALELYGTAHHGPPVFSQVIFAAPDVDQAVFAQQIGTVAPLAERLTLYTSDADLALSTSRRLHGGIARAGEGGADVLVTGPVETVDMSNIGSDMLRHSYFAGESSALADILWLFRRNAPPTERCGMEEAAKPEGPYWIFYAERCDGGVILSALSLAHEFGTGAVAEIERRVTGLADQAAIAELTLVQAMLEYILFR